MRRSASDRTHGVMTRPTVHRIGTAWDKYRHPFNGSSPVLWRLCSQLRWVVQLLFDRGPSINSGIV
jgi:hypothetical protein